MPTDRSDQARPPKDAPPVPGRPRNLYAAVVVSGLALGACGGTSHESDAGAIADAGTDAGALADAGSVADAGSAGDDAGSLDDAGADAMVIIL